MYLQGYIVEVNTEKKPYVLLYMEQYPIFVKDMLEKHKRYIISKFKHKKDITIINPVKNTQNGYVMKVFTKNIYGMNTNANINCKKRYYMFDNISGISFYEC